MIGLVKFFKTKNLRVGLCLGLLFLIFLTTNVKAQLQVFDFSGNNNESYQCFDEFGDRVNVSIYKNSNTGFYMCRGINVDGIPGDDRAFLKPPALQQIEVWFVKILYVIWALVGSFSFFLLVVLGYQYILRGGTTDTQLVELRKKIINYIVGFILVFLAVPILATIFRLLGVNTQAACYDVNMPGFQFFFTSVCTGNETYLRNVCLTPGAVLPDGLACGVPGTTVYCRNLTDGAITSGSFYCPTGSTGIYERSLWIQR